MAAWRSLVKLLCVERDEDLWRQLYLRRGSGSVNASRIPTLVTGFCSGLLKVEFESGSWDAVSQLLPRWILNSGWLVSVVHSETFAWQSNRPLVAGGLCAGGCGAVACGAIQL